MLYWRFVYHMSYISAIILGIVQGLTEFLPVSSTGHLILVRSWLSIADSHALAFDAVLHLATAAAVLLYFWHDLWALVQTFLRYIGRMPTNSRDMTLLVAIIVGTIPAAIGGFFLEDFMGTTFRAPLLVAVVLIIGSALLGVAEYVSHRQAVTRPVTVRTGFIVGLFQTLALIPGMSRAGASISGALLFGISRKDATRFAFLLSIPVILGAGLKKTLEMLSLKEAVSWGPIFVGALVAFIVGIVTIHFILGYVRHHTFWPFIWYRIVLALVVVLAVFAR